MNVLSMNYLIPLFGILYCLPLLGFSQNNFSAEEEALIRNGSIESPMRLFLITDPEDSTLLRQKSYAVQPDLADSTLAHFIERLYNTVTDSASMGVGIAAPQVGLLRRIIWVQRFDKSGFPFEVYLNPVIRQYSKLKRCGPEGCLSIPDRRDSVFRAYAILLEYDTPKGEHKVEMIEDFTATIFQHEIDHLNGILYIDHLAEELRIAEVPKPPTNIVPIKLDHVRIGRSPAEPTIAINPINLDNIVAGSVLDNVYRTEDGGKTWEKEKLTSSMGVYGDPAIVADSKGDFYYFHLSNPSNKAYSSPDFLDRIVVQKSRDAGKTWDDGDSLGEERFKDHDKEWAAVDLKSDVVYVTWTRFDTYQSQKTEDKSQIMFAKSTNRGKSWTEAKTINEVPGDCLDGDGTVEGAMPAVGPNGEVYVTWARDEHIYFDRSVNKGGDWLISDFVIAEQPGGWAFEVPGVARTNGMPVIECDLSNSPYAGTIYVNWSDQRNGPDDTDIWITKSTDGGNVWSPPIRVNNDEPGNQQFMSWMTVDPATGFIYVLFYDRRNYEDLQTDVYLAYSTNGGDSFENLRISNTPFVPQEDAFLGDYINIDALGGRICPIWTRMDSGVTSIWTAIINQVELTGE